MLSKESKLNQTKKKKQGKLYNIFLLENNKKVT